MIATFQYVFSTQKTLLHFYFPFFFFFFFFSLPCVIFKIPGGVFSFLLLCEIGQTNHSFVTFFCFFPGVCEGLKDVRVSVPQAIKRGETAIFMCDFDLEGDPLYSVKWYKGRSEFYRYTPKDEFPIKTFPLEGLHIDVSVEI